MVGAEGPLCFFYRCALQVGVIYGNPEVTSGGNALKYYASVRLEVSQEAVLSSFLLCPPPHIHTTGNSIHHGKPCHPSQVVHEVAAFCTFGRMFVRFSAFMEHGLFMICV
jgi:hypothetical protein